MYPKMYHHSRIPTILGGSGGGSLLPPELQACEYIEGDGHCHIIIYDKPLFPTNWGIKFKFLELPISGTHWILGSSSGNSNKNGLAYNQSLNTLCFEYSNTQTNYTINAHREFVVNMYNDWSGTIKDFDNNVLNTHTFSHFSYVTAYNWCLLGRNNSGTISEYPKPIQIYLSNTDNVNLLACYIKIGNEYIDQHGTNCPAGTPGMYDIINNVFYTNDGTGNFTPGPDIII